MNQPFATQHIIEVAYLVATVLFILSLKWLSAPTTARRGVWAGELGMLLAIAGTLLHHGIVDYKWIAIALVLGSIIGVPLGMVQMTAVPQRTALSHAFGAFCVTLVGTAKFCRNGRLPTRGRISSTFRYSELPCVSLFTWCFTPAQGNSSRWL